MRKVVHLVPHDGIGGVEAAARTMAEAQCDELEFQVKYIFPSVSAIGRKQAKFNPLYIIQSAHRITRNRPDVLVVSLWRSAIVGLLVRLMTRRVKLVVFVHNTVDAHLIDLLVTRCAIRHCTEVWADSAASIEERFRDRIDKPVQIISFLAHRISTPPEKNASPVFAFWGRLSPQKNLGRALGIFRGIKLLAPEASFLIIGPDDGERDILIELSRDLDIQDAVSFLGPADFSDICGRVRGASFYLQTSRYEGMAMSVVEAMQMGLVPIVTPVGEIANYCVHGSNSLFVRNDEEIPGLVMELIADQNHYHELRRSAIETWSETPLYADSIVAASRRLLAVEK